MQLIQTHADRPPSTLQVMVFEGTCYITPLLGAYLADSHWGRYKTILVFSTIYFCGCVLLTATSGLPGLTPGALGSASGRDGEGVSCCS